MQYPANRPSTPPSNSDVVQSKITFPVVGIGASAGGLEALLRLFENLPKGNGMAFVVVMHLSPQHESMAHEILQRSTSMPVQQVLQPTLIEAEHIYVIAPNKHLSMVDGFLSVKDLERPRGAHIAIDVFFRTLAEVHSERAVAVILSGTGADGAVGLTRIKEKGGVTIAQDPADAEHDGMPLAAIRTGVVDFVLPLADIPQKLVDLWQNARVIELPPTGDGEAPIARLTPPTQPKRPCKKLSAACSAIQVTISATTSVQPSYGASSAVCKCVRFILCRIMPPFSMWTQPNMAPFSATC